MSTHTAGPWHTSAADRAITTAAGWDIALLPVSNGPIGIDAMTANARLIAAAPDLLEAAYKAAGALQAFFGLLDAELLGNQQQLLTQDAKKISADALEVCRAAIRKATGEQS